MTDTAKKLEELEAAIAELKKAPVLTQVVDTPATELLRLDFGCGKNKKEGFKGVDVRAWEGVDVVLNIAESHWPWHDNSVDEAHASHFIEHLTWPQRIHFFNELGRVMKKGAKATVIWPHWCSDRYYGDPTHQAPMSPFGLFYLNKDWRAGTKEWHESKGKAGMAPNAPHVDYDSNQDNHFWHEYTCDFDSTISYSLAPWMTGRNQEFIQFAMAAYKEAAQDVMATLIRK